MGVKATSLEHATYDVRPQMGELTRVNGTAATSKGQVSLDLHKGSDGAMKWTVTPLFCKCRSDLSCISAVYPFSFRSLRRNRLHPNLGGLHHHQRKEHFDCRRF